MPTAPARSRLANVRTLQDQLGSKRPKEHFYVALLGLATYDAAKLHDRIEEGLSYESLERLRRALDISTKDFAELVRIPPRTLARRKEAKRLEADESDRLLRLSRIVGLALRLFEGGLAETRSWLSSPQPALGNETPLRLATTEVGAREVEYLVGRLEHGIPL